jgi:hypothetical protein
MRETRRARPGGVRAGIGSILAKKATLEEVGYQVPKYSLLITTKKEQSCFRSSCTSLLSRICTRKRRQMIDNKL